VKWPKNGFKSTTVFSDLQYFGTNLRTINEISTIEFHPEAAWSELRTVMTNGDEYTIDISDIDRITCFTHLQRSGTWHSGRNFDPIVIGRYMIADLSMPLEKSTESFGSRISCAQLIGTYFKDRMLVGGQTRSALYMNVQAQADSLKALLHRIKLPLQWHTR
jgi:hypothetical protein